MLVSSAVIEARAELEEAAAEAAIEDVEVGFPSGVGGRMVVHFGDGVSLGILLCSCGLAGLTVRWAGDFGSPDVVAVAAAAAVGTPCRSVVAISPSNAVRAVDRC